MLNFCNRGWSTEDADEALRNLAPSGADDAPSGVDDVCTLNLDDNKMTSVPESVTLLRNLEELYLGGNQIADLPVFITQLTALKILVCSNNQLSSVPPELSRLVKLEELWLYSNSLSSLSLPGSLVNLTNLRRYHFFSLPTFSFSSSFLSIYLEDNEQLPEHLQQYITNDHAATQSLLRQIALYQFQPLAARATLQWLLIWKHHLRHLGCIPRDVANIIAHMVFDSRASTVWDWRL